MKACGDIRRIGSDPSPIPHGLCDVEQGSDSRSHYANSLCHSSDHRCEFPSLKTESPIAQLDMMTKNYSSSSF